MIKGWQEIYYKGVKSWFYFNDSGIMQTGWQQLSWNGATNWYYFDANGVMVKDTKMKIDGKEYTFNASGALVS